MLAVGMALRSFVRDGEKGDGVLICSDALFLDWRCVYKNFMVKGHEN